MIHTELVLVRTVNLAMFVFPIVLESVYPDQHSKLFCFSNNFYQSLLVYFFLGSLQSHLFYQVSGRNYGATFMVLILHVMLLVSGSNNDGQLEQTQFEVNQMPVANLTGFATEIYVDMCGLIADVSRIVVSIDLFYLTI